MNEKETVSVDRVILLNLWQQQYLGRSRNSEPPTQIVSSFYCKLFLLNVQLHGVFQQTKCANYALLNFAAKVLTPKLPLYWLVISKNNSMYEVPLHLKDIHKKNLNTYAQPHANSILKRYVKQRAIYTSRFILFLSHLIHQSSIICSSQLFAIT